MRKKIKKTRYLKLLSKIIASFPFLLLVIIIGTIFYMIFNNFIIKQLKINSNNNELISAIISSVSDLFLVNGIMAIPNLNSNLKKAYFYLENRIYILSTRLLKNNWIKSKFIYAFNPTKKVAYNSQSIAIKKIIENFENNNNNLFYITGDSSVGKTSMLILLFEKCADELENYKILNNNTIYLCKSNTEKQLKNFIIDYSIGKYKKNYIFIDDLGEFSAISQMKLWNEVVYPILKNDTCNAKTITLVTTENNSIIRNKIINELDENAFLKIVKGEKHLKSISSKTMTFCKRHNINNLDLQSWIECIYSNKVGENLIDSLFDSNYSSLSVLFMCLVIVGKYSKIIDTKSVRKIYKECGYNRIKFNKNLKLLVKSNVITFFPFYKNYIYIEQNIFKQFVNFYKNDDLYLKIINIFESKYIIENDSEKWLLHCESSLLSKNYNFNSILFSNAFNSGNFNYLLSNLNELLIGSPEGEKYLLKELAYLNERVGNRNIAIKYLKQHIEKTYDIIEKSQSYLLLFEIEHHFNQDISKIKDIAKSPDVFLRLQGKYWLEHINIEKGIFNYDKLFDIVNNYSNIDDESNRLNYYHILRRMYSDLARVYFLNGEIDKNKFNTFEKKLKQSKLLNYHIEFEDYLNLLTVAHYLHYDVIFQMGFYGHFMHDCNDKYGSNPCLQDLINKAIKEYQKCEDNFKNYGDKAWMTISIRKNELLLTTNIQQIKIIDELNNLRNIFINNGNNLHLAFIDIVLCKAKFLQYYLNEFELDESETVKKCKNLLKEAKDISQKFNNKYGLFRVDFITCFLIFFEELQNGDKNAKKIFKSKLVELKSNNYHRESEMIEYILKSKEIKTDLVCNFFKYYPIVLQ